MYNSMGSVSGCMEDTREEVIGKIVEWMNGDGNQPMCWLHGAAGAGKSAISRTVAEKCAKNKRLAASFFFFRNAGRRSKITHLISTLAYDLAFSVPTMKQYIKKALKKDPHIIHRSLDDQFRTLITEPIQSTADRPLSKVVRLATGHTPPFVIIIDALDECDDKAMIVEFIEIVARAFADHDLPLRFLFTSRVEEHIRERFSTSLMLASTFRLALQDFDADADIRKFFCSRFSAIYEQKRRLMGSISFPWPSEPNLAKLVERSAGSFIFAFTLVNFVNDGTDLPHRKLQVCLQSHAGLDPLYTQILQSTPHNPHFRQIFETIIIIQEQLSIKDLACLFQMETGDVVHALLGVQSILVVPEDNNHPVWPFHTSLRDFLTTEARSGDFFINPSTCHLSITSTCLEAMSNYSGNGFVRCQHLSFCQRRWYQHLWCAIKEGGDNIFSSEDGATMMNKLIAFVSQLFDNWLDSIIYHEVCHGAMMDLDNIVLLLRVSSLLFGC